jgi:hypothetical protein
MRTEPIDSKPSYPLRKVYVWNFLSERIISYCGKVVFLKLYALLPDIWK